MSETMNQTDPENIDQLTAEGEERARTEVSIAADSDETTRLRAATVFEIIRREGEEELSRRFHALFWSALAAGISIGFSVIAEALLAARLPDTPWKPLIDNLGYSVGFLIVILARQQLFTENTLTPVLPVLARGKVFWYLVLLRLWGIVLLGNLLGCMIFALFLAYGNVMAPDVAAATVAIGNHLMENTASEMFLKGIVSGWLIAALVWMLPSSEGSEFIVITLMTYLIALGDFTHVIAGSVEVFYLCFTGNLEAAPALFVFFLPTLLGNVVGGTLIFGVLSYAQVREELPAPGHPGTDR